VAEAWVWLVKMDWCVFALPMANHKTENINDGNAGEGAEIICFFAPLLNSFVSSERSSIFFLFYRIYGLFLKALSQMQSSITLVRQWEKWNSVLISQSPTDMSSTMASKCSRSNG
jgi:hypothetical protein